MKSYRAMCKICTAGVTIKAETLEAFEEYMKKYGHNILCKRCKNKGEKV